MPHAYNQNWTDHRRDAGGLPAGGARPGGVGDLDDRDISRHVWGSQQGQLTRFEGLLLASMGEHFIEHHRWRHVDWFVAARREWLRRLHEANVPVGDCRPSGA